MAAPQSATPRLSGSRAGLPLSSPRPVPTSPHGGEQPTSALLTWNRASGSPALLPRTAPASPHSSLLLILQTSAPPGGEDVAHAPLSPTLCGACSPARRAACASPRALGDVPLLLSEQERWAPLNAGSNGTSAAPALAIVQQHAAAMAAATAAAAAAAMERRTRDGSARLAALQGAAAAHAVSSCALCMVREESFGADSKFGFDQPHLGSGVFMMEDYD